MTEQPQKPGPEQAFATPSHEDFETLVRILRDGISAAAEDPDFDMEEYATQYVDVKSIGYLALQRVMGAFGFQSPVEVTQQMALVMRLSMLYLEAFIVGVQFEQDQTGTNDTALGKILERFLTGDIGGSQYVSFDTESLTLDATVPITPEEHALLSEYEGD